VPASIRARINATRSVLLSRAPDGTGEALIDYVDAKFAEIRSHLSIIRRESRTRETSILDQLSSMSGRLDQVLDFSQTAAAGRGLSSLQAELETSLRLPWASVDDLCRLREHPQLRQSLGQYLEQFVSVTPCFVSDLMAKLIGENLYGMLYMPHGEERTRISWGQPYYALPTVVINQFLTVVHNNDALRPHFESLRQRLASKLSHQREQRRHRWRCRLQRIATSEDGGEYSPVQRTAAAITLIDGREDLRLIRGELRIDVPGDCMTFVERYAGPVYDAMHAQYPDLADYQAAIRAALAPFVPPNERQRERRE